MVQFNLEVRLWWVKLRVSDEQIFLVNCYIFYSNVILYGIDGLVVVLKLDEVCILLVSFFVLEEDVENIVDIIFKLGFQESF